MPAQSHIAPMLPLACAAHQEGHDVVFATNMWPQRPENALPLAAPAPRPARATGLADPAYSAASARLREQILSMPTPADLLGRLDELVAGDSHRQPLDIAVAGAASTIDVASFGARVRS
jgi:hypothetical protein